MRFCYSVLDALQERNPMKRETKFPARLVVLDSNDPISAETEEIQSRIRERAYELSQERGHAGREVDDWLTAESEIISVPPLELIEKGGMFQVRLGIVGLNLEDMRVLTSPDRLLVRGEYRHQSHIDDGTIHLRDFKSTAVFRSVQFPEPIDVNSVQIEFQDGVLRITAAKAGPPVEKQAEKQAQKQVQPQMEQPEPKRPVAVRKAAPKKRRAS
jgi:HSP20 family molecular chaperone IbpA